MNSRHSLLPWLLMSGCVAILSQFATAQDGLVPQRAKVISSPSAENVKELYVAIMGEVVKPGTYHLDPVSLKLQSVVQRAGGLTSEASPTIRVIRQGRFNHKEIYSDKVSTPLFPGDLLIVDAKRSIPRFANQFSIANEPTTLHARDEERANAVGVQVALVNAADYPLVLRLRPDEASAVNIVEGLGQPIELLANTYVITPDTFPRSTSEVAKHAIRLAQGSVMVFDRDRVNRNRLPSTLPRPIESEISMGAQPGLIGSPWGQSPELRNLGQRMASSADATDQGEQFPHRRPLDSSESSTGSSDQTLDGNRSEANPSVGLNKPRIANLPFSGIPRVTNSSTIHSRMDRSTSESIPQPDDSTDDSALTTVAPSLTLEDEVPSRPSSFSFLQVFVLMLIVSVLIGGALLLRRILETNSVELNSLPISRSEDLSAEVTTADAGGQTQLKSLLEQLIKNELPISIESIEFPNELVLQGRIAERPILRVDGPQSILKQNGPHFGPSDRSAVGRTLKEMIADYDAPDAAIVRRPHFIDAERQTVEAPSSIRQDVDAAKSDDPSNAPLANALFQLEQGGRS